MNTKDFIWVEKYRPTTLDEMILNDDVRTLIQSYFTKNTMDNLILYGSAGTGKTTLTQIICKHFTDDVLYINASDERGIDAIRDKVKPYAYANSFSDMKIVVLNEADQLTFDAKLSLKQIVEETHETTKFILCANNISKLTQDDTISSRFVTIQIKPEQDKWVEVAKKCVSILQSENIQYSESDKSDIKKLVLNYFPDVRKTIRVLQQYSASGKLDVKTSLSTTNHNLILNEFSSNNSLLESFSICRNIIKKMNVEERNDLFSFLFSHCSNIYTNSSQFIEAMMIIADYNKTAYNVVDFELHINALICSLLKIKKK